MAPAPVPLQTPAPEQVISPAIEQVIAPAIAHVIEPVGTAPEIAMRLEVFGDGENKANWAKLKFPLGPSSAKIVIAYIDKSQFGARVAKNLPCLFTYDEALAVKI